MSVMGGRENILYMLMIVFTLCNIYIYRLYGYQKYKEPNPSSKDLLKIAIGMGITSHHTQDLNRLTLHYKLVFFNDFIPTFCATASKGYLYSFYLAFDKEDSFFSKPNSTKIMEETFKSVIKNCDLKMTMTMVQCTHDQSPAWAQNDAMMEAYLDNCDYYYRVNDDTHFVTPNWTDVYIKKLLEQVPPNIGVVGPRSNESVDFLTYDFVHRTHIDILGFYYPRIFYSWWADVWICQMYKPGRYHKLDEVLVRHTKVLGRRYKSNWEDRKYVAVEKEKTKKVLKRYVTTSFKGRPYLPKRVISVALDTSTKDHWWGAIRNAQLLPIHFPGWVMHVYSHTEFGKDAAMGRKIMQKLRNLGAVVKFVNVQMRKVPSSLWTYLAADDPDVDLFITRSALGRISDSDFRAVNRWLTSGLSYHCFCEKCNNTEYFHVAEVLGMQVPPMRCAVNATMEDFLSKATKMSKCNATKTQQQGDCKKSVEQKLMKLLEQNVIHMANNNNKSSHCDKQFLIEFKESEVEINKHYDAYGYPLNITKNMP